MSQHRRDVLRPVAFAHRASGEMSATVPASEPARQNGLPRPVSIEGYLQQIRAWASSQNPSLQDLLAYPKWLHGVTEALLSLLETHPQIRPSVEAHARS